MAPGCGIDGAEQRDHAGKQLAGHLRAADAQAVHGDVVGGDPALGDDPGGPGGQRPGDGPGQGRGDRAGDGQAVRRHRGRGPGCGWCTAGHRSGAAPSAACSCRVGRHLVRAGDDGGDVEFDVGGGAPRAQRGKLPAGLADVGSDHDQAVPAAAGRGQICGPRSGAIGAPGRPGPARTRARCGTGTIGRPARPAAPRGHRLQVGVLGGVDDGPGPVPQAGQQVRRPGTARRSLMSARLMLATSPRPDRSRRFSR